MDRVAVITGGTSGFGYEIARLLKEQGEKVVVISRNPQKVTDTMNALHVDGFAGDITREADWGHIYDYVMQKYGHADLLVNNAGGAICFKPFIEQTTEEILAGLNLNLLGAMLGCKAFAPGMAACGKGTIINIASVCARHAWPLFSTYSAAKSGLLSFSKVLYTELRSAGVRVSCLYPGSGETNFDAAAGADTTHTALQATDFARAVVDVFNLPSHVVVEEMSVWGNDQEVIPL